MPFTSTQISGLVGGQQVMFSNQATFAHQISGEGGSQQMMANPYPSPSYGVAGLDPGSPDIGTKLAGGAAMALPGIAAGGTMAASMLGYKSSLGLLDPFTAATRGFGAGTGGGVMARAGVMSGAEGMGLRYAAGNISGAFAQGGLRAGLGALGGGLAGAAVAALPAYVAGSAINYAAGQVYQGVQNVQDVRRMASQYFEPQYGRPGAGMGGKPGMAMAGQVTSFMQELASEDTTSSMKDMRKLMDKAGQMGMLQGVGDANQFKEKFRAIVAQTKKVAQILGTTLEEALPLTNQLQSMGMWTAKDVMGTAGAIKAAGPGGAQAMMGSMQQGAQMSHAMGGRLESGARLGQDLFGQVSAATRTGTFSSQDIRNFTGGVGGAEGQRMVAGGLQQVMSGFGQSAMGRLMMAGLGETKDGAFTGRMDEKLLSQFNRGQIGVAELQSRGQRRINTSQEMATSFFNVADELGQDMAQKGGITGMAAGIQQAMVKAGRGDAPKNIQNKFIQMITGANQRQANMIQKIIDDLPRIQAEQERATAAALEDSFRQMEEKRSGLDGITAAVGKSFHEAIGKPLEQLGERLAVQMSEGTDRLSNKIMGRTKSLPRLSINQQMMMTQAGALRGGPSDWSELGVQNVGQSMLEGTWSSNMAARISAPGGFGRLAKGAGAGALLGAASPIPGGTVLGGLAGLGAAAFGAGETTTPATQALMRAGLTSREGTAGAGDMSVGGGRVVNVQQAHNVARRAYARSLDPTLGGLFGGETPEKLKAEATLKARLGKVFNTAEGVEGLDEMRKNQPDKYPDEVVRRLKMDPEARKAMELLGRSAPGGAGGRSADFDVLAMAQASAGYGHGGHSIDFSKMASDIPGIPGSIKEVEKFREENLEKMMTAANGSMWGSVGFGAAAGAAVGSMATPILGTLIGAGVGAAAGALGHMGGSKLSQGDLEAALSSDKYTAKDIAQYMSSKSGKFAEAISKGDSAAMKLKESIEGMSSEQKGKFAEGLKTESATKYTQFKLERKGRLESMAKSEGAITEVAGVRDRSVVSGLESARSSFAKGDVSSGEQTLESLSKKDLSNREINMLLSGRGGEGGRQVGRLAAIRGMGEMDAEQFTKFRNKLNRGGVDLMSAPGISERVNEMLNDKDKKIRGGEVGELRDLLKGVAPAALGHGPGAKMTPEQESQQKYIQATEKFSTAVERLVGKDKGMQDVVQENAVAAG
jgi:hypothetical protein